MAHVYFERRVRTQVKNAINKYIKNRGSEDLQILFAFSYLAKIWYCVMQYRHLPGLSKKITGKNDKKHFCQIRKVNKFIKLYRKSIK